MKALLLHRDRDFDLQQRSPDNVPALITDLELETVFQAMANGDEFVFNVARKAILVAMENDVDTILYRQAILKDCLKRPEIARQLYDLAGEALQKKKKHWFGLFASHPSSILYDSIELMHLFVDMLRKLRDFAAQHASGFESEGFTALFSMLQRELSDAYFAEINHHLQRLKFHRGVLVSAQLGEGNEGTNYVLRKANRKEPAWLTRVMRKGPPSYTYRIAERDEAGARALSELQDRGINLVGNALAQSVDHVVSFFTVLRTELAFYVGCLNLYERLMKKEEPACFPVPLAAGEGTGHFTGLYDISLTLTMESRVVSNSVNADGKRLVIITGANQGGKTTFLRTFGTAQLMMQCGMFVGAAQFSAEVRRALFTHYKREEDPTMKSGKFDEELARMSEIVDHLVPGSLLLFNESFAATNEREGSEIATQIVRALLEKGLKVFFVTHLYEFAHGFLGRRTADALFLRAERQPDGTRTFRLTEGEPLETSYGEDVYQQVFDTSAMR